MKITGELLKSERIKQNLGVQDVAFSLKLSSKIITSIESGRLDELPAKTFVRGFVKSYAQLLKVDVDQVMRQFQEEMGSTNPMPKTPPPMPSLTKSDYSGPTKKERPQPTQTLHADNSKKTFLYIGVAVALVILIITMNKIIDKYQKDSVENATIAQIKPLEAAPSTAVSGDAVSKLSVPFTEVAGSVNTSIASPAKPTALATSLESSSNLSLSPEDGFAPSSGKPVEVIIEAKKNVELLYAKGNSKNFSRLNLQSKQIQVIRSSDGLYLKADDGGAIHLIVNGIEKGTAGSNNKPIKLTF
ncbi:MAG: helix-turn-helix domain-containing protein [Bdellovibrio sp.]|nr:helix-turn-helix domain-containing protein [Bdellovibrio sp.]